MDGEVGLHDAFEACPARISAPDFHYEEFS
jgi:hypothetical protein